jgi:chemotaxis protein methyltransferase CheR
MISPDLAYIRRLVGERSSVVLDETKDYLIASRLESLARQERDGSVEALLGRLRSGPSEGLSERVVEALITNETSFFRDPASFEALRWSVLPVLLGARAWTRRLDIWSAGCSSGQEAYSIAMTIDQALPKRQGWKAHVLGTDLALGMIACARRGVFSAAEVGRGLAPSLRARYLEPQGAEWCVRDELRALTRFEPLNLMDSWSSLPAMDVVFLRNVLIYFSDADRRTVLGRVRRLLRPDGVLFLGAGETTVGFEPAFLPVLIGRSYVYRRRPDKTVQAGKDTR